MARKTITTVVMVDDIDSTEGESVKACDFELFGRSYSIDLKPENAVAFASLLKKVMPFLDAASPATKSPPLPPVAHPNEEYSAPAPQRPVKRQLSHSQKVRARTDELKLMRAWGKERGYDVGGDRGRMPADTEAAYHARNNHKIDMETVQQIQRDMPQDSLGALAVFVQPKAKASA